MSRAKRESAKKSSRVGERDNERQRGYQARIQGAVAPPPKKKKRERERKKKGRR